VENVILIGTSGWAYDHWKGVFYAKDASQEDLLPAYARSFRTVEVNSTFYGLPSAETVEGWRHAVPDGFTFAVKANRYITHMKNLLEPEKPIARMIGRIQGLGEKLGPILFQLTPSSFVTRAGMWIRCTTSWKRAAAHSASTITGMHPPPGE
jgi:uncharacterized protein YecE (DUF72 family)